MFDGMDMNALMQQAQQMQEQLLAAQREQTSRTFEGTAGGDLVKVSIDGEGRVKEVTIDPKAVDPEDVETLQDLIVAAYRSAREQSDESLSQLLPNLGQGEGGMPQVPGL